MHTSAPAVTSRGHAEHTKCNTSPGLAEELTLHPRILKDLQGGVASGSPEAALRTQETSQRQFAETAPSVATYQALRDRYLHMSLLWWKFSVPTTLVAPTAQ